VSRLASTFAGPGKKLVIYVTCGDPSLDATVAIVRAAEAAGADAIELGIPFSDPSADGPAIQLAMERALAAGVGPREVLEVVRRLRAAGSEIPIVLFGYYNPIFVQGAHPFCAAAAAAGADGLIVVDLPVDESEELAGPAREHGLDLIPLVAPTSSPARMDRVAAVGAPFVYYVSITGVTGAALTTTSDLTSRVADVRTHVRAPVAVGFGVATPTDATRVAQAADAVVVGSAVVRTIEKHPSDPATAVGAFVASLKAAI
jgi:tryptophan synthase alpha chain